MFLLHKDCLMQVYKSKRELKYTHFKYVYITRLKQETGQYQYKLFSPCQLHTLAKSTFLQTMLFKSTKLESNLVHFFFFFNITNLGIFQKRGRGSTPKITFLHIQMVLNRKIKENLEKVKNIQIYKNNKDTIMQFQLRRYS